MSRWEMTTLGELATFQNGYAFKPAELGGTAMPVIRIKQLLDHRADVDYTDAAIPEKFLIDTGDLIFSWSGTLASVLWDRGPAFLNQHLFRVTERPGISRRWLHYVIEGAVDDLLAKSHGTTMKHITKKALLAHEATRPALPEQRRIADVMTAVDAQIDALTQEIYNGRVAYRDALATLLWLDEAGAESSGQSLKAIMQLDVERLQLRAEAKYRSAGVLNAGQGLIDKGPFLGKETGYESMNVLREGQLVMRKLTAWEGPIAVVPAAFDGFVASNEFPTFTLNDDVSPNWMKHVCRAPRLWAEMKNRVTGTVQRRKRLNPDQLLGVVLPIPPHDVQERVASMLDAMDRQVLVLNSELSRLRIVRSTLLTSLLNQEIEIPESYDALLEGAS